MSVTWRTMRSPSRCHSSPPGMVRKEKLIPPMSPRWIDSMRFGGSVTLGGSISTLKPWGVASARSVPADSRPSTLAGSWSKNARRSIPSAKVRFIASGRMTSTKPPRSCERSLKTIAIPRSSGWLLVPATVARPAETRRSRLLMLALSRELEVQILEFQPENIIIAESHLPRRPRHCHAAPEGALPEESHLPVAAHLHDLADDERAPEHDHPASPLHPRDRGPHTPAAGDRLRLRDEPFGLRAPDRPDAPAPDYHAIDAEPKRHADVEGHRARAGDGHDDQAGPAEIRDRRR